MDSVLDSSASIFSRDVVLDRKIELVRLFVGAGGKVGVRVEPVSSLPSAEYSEKYGWKQVKTCPKVGGGKCNAINTDYLK